MATAYKVLGRANPSGTLTTYSQVYTLPGATDSAILSTIAVCNTTSVDQAFRIAISASSSAPNLEDHIAYESTVAAYDTSFITIGAVVDTNSPYLLASSSVSGIVFSAFGAEIS